MMKKCVALFLALMMVLSLTTAVAESDADALDYDELMNWAEGFKTRALAAGAPLNDPTEEAAYTEDGYAFVYDFATLYMDRPEMTADSVLQAVVVYSPEEQGPRGTGVDQLSSEVLNAFYNENDDLQGDSSFAALYVSDTMPAGALWGWVQRDGQRIETIQYAVHEQLSSGGDGYTDCGLVYTLSDNLVAAIRAYGLNETISADEVRSNLDAVQEVSEKTEYAQVPTSINGSELAMFDRDDLIFSGLDFLSLTPEEAEARLARCAAELPVYTAELPVLERLTGYALTRGMLCAMRRPALRHAEDLLQSTSCVAVLEDVMNPTNLGAIFRSAAALGVEAVLLTESCTDPLYRRCIRVSMGNVFFVPWAYLPDDQWQALLHENGFESVAMALREDAKVLWDPALREIKKIAVVMGSEGPGLKASTIASCDYTVTVPMTNGVDSLNVAAASAVAFYQLALLRQHPL